MSYFKEAAARWKGQTPPWFKKTQALCAALIVMGTSIAGVSIASTKLNWVTLIGSALVGAGTIGGAVCQFVVSTATIVLEPGDTLQNQSEQALPVTIGTNTITEPDKPKEAVVTDPPPQLP
jgi:hypothetical protein